MLSEQKYTVKSVIKLLQEKFSGVELPSINSIPESILNRQVPSPQFFKPTLFSIPANFEEYQSLLSSEIINEISAKNLVSILPPIDNVIYGTEKPDTLIGTKLNDLIFGLGEDDLIFGLDGADIIIGGDGSDIAFGGAGNDLIAGGNGDDFVFGESGNDLVFGDAGNDQIFGSQGNDSFYGGSGKDTADYSNLGEAITLQAKGIVDKGSAGSDQLSEIETIIGANKQANTIDASGGTSNTTSLDVNLASNNLIINGFPGLGTLKFQVKNFLDVKGTAQGDKIIGNNFNNQLLGENGDDIISGLYGNDNINGDEGNDILSGGGGIPLTITAENSVISARYDGNDIVNGNNGNDTVLGGTGFDELDGGSGVDTVDYSLLGQAITIKPAGEIDKGKLGVDQISNFETVIGAEGEANKIDGSTVTYGITSLYVDLSAEKLTVKNVPSIGDLNFKVKEFVNVTGTSQTDNLTGNSDNNILVGGGADDIVSGESGKDTLIGVNQNFARPGLKETDILLGGVDSDLFVLGDAQNAYYVGNGSNDKAFLTDFQTGEDLIQLNGSIKDYVIQNSNVQNLAPDVSTNIYRKPSFADSADSLTPSIVSPGDLIAVVNGTVAKSDLIFVSDEVVI